MFLPSLWNPMAGLAGVCLSGRRLPSGSLFDWELILLIGESNPAVLMMHS